MILDPLHNLPYLAIQALALVIGLVVHESSHALAAYLLGDRTARERGRISLNPLNHIDPFGTVLLPLLMMLAGGPVFAFAKPVPVYLGNLRNPKRDEVLISLAGPVSNILLACLATFIWWLFGQSGLGYAIPWELAVYIVSFITYGITVNLSLAFFNLIPLPPLDGSSILVPFLKGGALRTYYRIQQYAMPILICVLYLVPTVLHIDIIGMYLGVTVYPLANLLLGLAMG